MRGRKALCMWTVNFDCVFSQPLPILREVRIWICKESLYCPSTEKNFSESKSTSLLLKNLISGF